ncbi:MAG TPA: hypothetical protein VK178_09095 [Opitutaceae bacterium]|nr:hypothetical protein [Opitutaceae bacterium]
MLARMIFTARADSRSDSAEPLIEFVSRLWLRTALAAWAVWLGCVLIALVRGAAN